MDDDLGAARALLSTRHLVVLDLDGPLTRLLPGQEYLRVTAGALELALSLGLEPDDELAAQTDHVQLLRLVARRNPEAGRVVERWCTDREVAAAAGAPLADGAETFVTACLDRGAAVAVVTNNAPEAAAAVLATGGPALAGLPVHGRDTARPEHLKPSPHPLLAAAEGAGVAPADAVMVGDSLSDVQAATAAGMPCIGLSPDPERRAELRAAGAVAVAPDLAGLGPGPV
ncbi:HAD family hydrolase [Georgenia satyanarayanai]|uniref:HAD family hydrolase n=1 Tax=Georgenia satyanarayanai TaxID=860221 RepID=UPI00203FB2A1|nr:HAD family hydrolase [Georgenia satyanarayanai]MCM3660904.1 HAD family hydrolase [Georgenia satyanarayanai]